MAKKRNASFVEKLWASVCGVRGGERENRKREKRENTILTFFIVLLYYSFSWNTNIFNRARETVQQDECIFAHRRPWF